MKIQGIYKIRNCTNGKVYIGQSIDIENRWKTHKDNVKTTYKHPLYDSMKKHGLDNFEFNVIEEVIDINTINAREQYWMDYYKSYNSEFGYNICKESTTTRGYKHTDGTKEKISKIHKGKKLSEQHKRNFSWLGKKHSNETKLKMSAWQKGIKKSKDIVNKWKISYKEYCSDPLNRQKMAENKKALYKNNVELKNRISDSVKRLWKDENYRNNQITKRKGIKRIFLDLDKVKDLYLVKNFTIRQIACYLNVDDFTVSKFLKEKNIKKPYSSYCKNVIDLSRAKDLYLIQNFTMEESAKLLGVSAWVFSRFLKVNNIKKDVREYYKSKIKDEELHKLLDNNIKIGVV